MNKTKPKGLKLVKIGWIFFFLGDNFWYVLERNFDRVGRLQKFCPKAKGANCFKVWILANIVFSVSFLVMTG